MQKDDVMEFPETGTDENGRQFIILDVGKWGWASEPSGGDLKHVLNIKIPMNTHERDIVERMNCELWEFKAMISGSQKPKQASFETEGFGDDNGKELED